MNSSRWSQRTIFSSIQISLTSRREKEKLLWWLKNLPIHVGLGWITTGVFVSWSCLWTGSDTSWLIDKAGVLFLSLKGWVVVLILFWIPFMKNNIVYWHNDNVAPLLIETSGHLNLTGIQVTIPYWVESLPESSL